ncbi:MAG: thioredoxin domain-containing protein [Bacillota bacterium]|nr:thioredoxin domain-containing protein [Bacillota bacterium]
MTSEEEKKANQSSINNIETVSEYQQKRESKKLLRILIPALIVVVAVGLYLLKNPIGTPAETTIDPAKGIYASAEFDLDATLNFDLDKILSYGLPVIIDFGADSCVPCKEMAPVLVELNNELRGKAIVKFVDVWKNNQAAAGLPLEVIPTQFFFNADGTPYVPADEEAAARNGFIMYEMRDSGEHVFTVHQGGLDKETMLEVLKEMGME